MLYRRGKRSDVPLTYRPCDQIEASHDSVRCHQVKPTTYLNMNYFPPGVHSVISQSNVAADISEIYFYLLVKNAEVVTLKVEQKM